MKPLLFTCCLLLTACANNPTPFANAVPSTAVFAFQGAGESTLRVTRDSGFHGAAFSAVVVIDGVRAAELDQGESAAFGLPSGDHIVSVEFTGTPPASAAFNLHPGKTTTARVSTGIASGIYPTSLNE